MIWEVGVGTFAAVGRPPASDYIYISSSLHNLGPHFLHLQA